MSDGKNLSNDIIRDQGDTLPDTNN